MANKLIKRRYNNLLTARNNYFSGEQPGSNLMNRGPVENLFGYESAEDILNRSMPKYIPVPQGRKAFFQDNPGLGAAGSAVGNIGGGLIGGGLQSGVGNTLQGLSGIAAAIPGPWGAVASAGLGLIGGLTNRMFGSKMNTENIAKVESNIDQLNSFQSSASDFDTLSQNWANAATGMTFKDSYIGKDGWFSNKAKKKAADLRRQIEEGNAWVQNSLVNNATNIRDTQMQNLLTNYAAFGGDLMTHGANFDTGLTLVGNGGTHEENPNEGVPMGVDKQGIPNLVEEGEVIFNDYVFSKRLKVPKAVKNKYKLRGSKLLTFADAALQMGKESEERPNDPISQAGLDDSMMKLMIAQEQLKADNDARQFAMGGHLFAKGGNKKSKKKTPAKPFGDRGPVYWDGDPTRFNPYNPDGSINFDILADNSIYNPYIQRLHKLYGVYNNPAYLQRHFSQNITGDSLYAKARAWEHKFIRGLNEYNKETKGYEPVTMSSLIENYEGNFANLIHENIKNPAWAWALNYAGAPPESVITEHILRNADGTLTAIPETDIYYPGKNFNTGKTWEETFGDKYVLDKTPVKEYNQDSGITNERYFYTPKQSPVDNYYMSGDNGQYNLVEGDNPSLTAKNSGFRRTRVESNATGGKDYYYDPMEETTTQSKPAPTWMRYTPAFASGIMSITDALGFTNKPDYGDAGAVLEAARNTGRYSPVKFNPVGNYLTYKPLDRDFYINKLNAEASAARRSVLNTSGGNRAQAMAGILASDYNTQGKMGELFRQAEEYNLAQRQKVEEFNRATDMFNSEGTYKANQANQAADISARSSYLKGALTAAEMRQRERQAATASRSANLSNFINSLGDIGWENASRNMIISDPSKYYTIDSNMNVHYKPTYYSLTPDQQDQISGHASRQTMSRAKGGYLTIKRKRRK